MVTTLRENLGMLWQSSCYSTGNLDFKLIKREKDSEAKNAINLRPK